MSYVPQPYREIDLLMRGSEQTAGLAQAAQRQKRVHPILEQILREYGDKLLNGQVTAEQVHEETAKRLRAYGAQTGSTFTPSGAEQGEVPLAQPAQGDIQPPGQAAQPTLGTPNQMPQQAPGTGPSLAQPMQQASGVASQMMAGQPPAPQAQRPQSLGQMNVAAPQAGGPMLTQPMRQRIPVSQEPITEGDLDQFAKVTPFINSGQRPELEREKATAKAKAAQYAQEAKLELEKFKQGNQNNRLAAKLDVALNVANARLEADGQKMVAHMTEVLLQIQGRLQAAREQIAGLMARRQGDWKVQVMAIKQRVLDSNQKLLGQLSNSINYVVDPKVQGAMEDARLEAEAANDDFASLSVEVGAERGSDSLANPPSLTGEKPKPAGEKPKVEEPVPAAPKTDVSNMADPYKAASDKAKKTVKKTKKATKKYMFNPASGQMEEVK